MLRQCRCWGPLASAQSVCSSECEYLDCSLYLPKESHWVHVLGLCILLFKHIYIYIVIVSVCTCELAAAHAQCMCERQRTMWSNQSSPATMWVPWLELRILQLDWKHCHVLNYLTSLESSFLTCTVLVFFSFCMVIFGNYWFMLSRHH